MENVTHNIKLNTKIIMSYETLPIWSKPLTKLVYKEIANEIAFSYADRLCDLGLMDTVSSSSI